MVSRMNTKNDVEVVINGKQYTLCGYESSDYLQQIARHINDKYTEFKQQDGYNRFDTDMKNILLAINLTDDYYKAQNQADALEHQKEALEKEIFEMKHELIARQTRIEELEKTLQEVRKSCEEAEHQVIRLETELSHAASGREQQESEEAGGRDVQSEAAASREKAGTESGQSNGNRRSRRKS